LPSEPIEQAIKGLLAEAAAATAKLDWTTVASLADAALKLDPENTDALTFKSLAADGTNTVSSEQTIEQEIAEARRIRSSESVSSSRKQKTGFLSKKKLVAAVLVIIVGAFYLNIANADTTDEVCELITYRATDPEMTLKETAFFWRDVRSENERARAEIATPVADFLTGKYASDNSIAERRLDQLSALCASFR